MIANAYLIVSHGKKVILSGYCGLKRLFYCCQNEARLKKNLILAL